MFPERLENDTEQIYFSEDEYFCGNFNYIHTYLHTNYKYKMHAHQFYEINIVASGKGRHYIEDTSLDAEMGDVFVIPPGVSHGYYSEGELDIYHVLIKKDFLARYAEELAEIEGFEILFNIEPEIRRSSGKALNLNVGSPDFVSFKAELERMKNIEASGRFVYLNALTIVFICRLCRRICGSISESCEKEIVGVMEYIRNNLDRKLSLSELSSRAHMSTATLNRRFRSSVGMSPIEYILSCRVARAKELISESNIRRTDIAQICGFYDVAHMNKYL
ncbi:MAG: AraC family transcriptional regulator [Clostridia bacterium]|nr:AraC family transcriptional regulator [Clostridia bacterium]